MQRRPSHDDAVFCTSLSCKAVKVGCTSPKRCRRNDACFIKCKLSGFLFGKRKVIQKYPQQRDWCMRWREQSPEDRTFPEPAALGVLVSSTCQSPSVQTQGSLPFLPLSPPGYQKACTGIYVHSVSISWTLRACQTWLWVGAGVGVKCLAHIPRTQIIMRKATNT